MTGILSPEKRQTLCWLILLAAIWMPVVYLLGAQWCIYDEYNYGWAVPLLCVYLAVQKFPSRPPVCAPGWGKKALFLLVAAGLVYWVMRVLQEANPVWRLASYGLTLAAVAITLLTVFLTQGGRRAAHFAFPVVFFLVGPWPTPVEDAVIQTLTRFNAGLVVEMLNFTGVPALLHGNVIEISTGMVGIDEACSGIRSFQATLVIALFLGAFYRLDWARRWWLLGAGPALALAFNFTRTLVLVLVAAHAGLPAMERWHDPTGVAVLVGCFLCLWGVAVWMARGGERRGIEKEHRTSNIEHPILSGGKPEAGEPQVEAREQKADVSVSAFQNFSVPILAICLAIWTVTVEVSTEAWFRSHEARADWTIAWTARWPADNHTLRTNTIPDNALRLLQCDQNTTASWIGEGDVFWQVFYLRWFPADSFYGRAKVAMSKTHNPAICLTASGMKLELQLDPVSLPVHPGFSLNFDRFVFLADGHELYVFFSQKEDVTSGAQANLRMTHMDRLRAALAGSRNYGQINFEAALAGPENAADALRIFSAHLPELINSPTNRP